MLTQKQKEIYLKDGYIIIKNLIPNENLQAMQIDLEKWIEETLIVSEHRPKVEVKLAKLGSSAGAIGAAISTTNYF